MREASIAAGVVLHERERELAELQAVVERVAVGASDLVVIEGPPGIGKSALLGELTGLAAQAEFRVLTARGTSLESALAWSVVRRLLVEAVTDADPGDRLALLAGAAGLARRVLGVTEDEGIPVDLSGALHGLYWLTMNLAEGGPVLLVVDDVHWSDRQSLRYLNYLAHRLGDAPILLAVAVRSGDPGAVVEGVEALRGQASLTQRPGALTERATSALVRQLLGGRATPQICADVHAATAGNPFLACELCRELEQLDRLGQPLSVERAVVSTPERVARSVSARLARLPALAAAIAEAVAILGAAATASRITRLTGAEPGDVAEQLAVLVEGELLLERGPALEFVHPLVREAVYSGMPASRRAAAHTRAAELLHAERASNEDLAEQLLWASPEAKEWRVDALRGAAEAARAAGAPDAAARYLERALDEPPAEHRAAEVLLELGTTLLQHDPAAAVGHLEEARRRAGVPAEAAEVALALAQAYATMYDFSAAIDVLSKFAARLGPEHRELRRRVDNARLTFTRWDYGSQPTRRELFDALRARAAAEEDLDCGERANLAQELAALGEDREWAIEHATAVVEQLGSISGPQAMGHVLVTSVLVLADRPDLAASALDQAVARAQARGSRVDAAVALTMASYCALRQGRLLDAIEYAEAALELMPGIWSTGSIAWLIEARAERGEARAVQGVLASHGLAEPAAVGTPDRPMGYQQAVLLHHRGRARALLGEYDAALADFMAVAELARVWGVGNPAALDWRSRAARCLLALNRSEEAAALARAELPLARRWGAPTPIGTALSVAGQCEPGPEGVGLMREAVEVLTRSPALLDRAHALVALGVRLRRERHGVEARGVLKQGLDLAHRCSATLLADRARDELVAAGGKPRRDALSGHAALTGRELRVAELAVSGLTNRRIAQALFVSPRTVEHHLRSVYRKLGITSREQLPTAMAAGPGRV